MPHPTLFMRKQRLRGVSTLPHVPQLYKQQSCHQGWSCDDPHRWVWNGEGMPWDSLETKQRPRPILVLFQEQVSTNALSGLTCLPSPPIPPKVHNCYRDRERETKETLTAQQDRTENHLYHSHMHDLGWVPQSGPQFPNCNLGIGPDDSNSPCSSNILWFMRWQ